MPVIPTGAEVWQIEQGYFDAGATEDGSPKGRIRRVTHASGKQQCFHTIKRGEGLVRIESEREIEAAEFDRWWPQSANRRLTKTRHRVRVAGHVWEIDQFHSLQLVLAEVELRETSEQIEIPAWIAPLVVREVTTDARWRNASLATRGVPMESASPP